MEQALRRQSASMRENSAHESATRQHAPRDFPVNIHLLGPVDFEDCLTLQRRLAYDATTRPDGRIIVLICEHRQLITIGRAGSRAHVRFTGSELVQRQLTIRYVSRGGGAILHAPGQLAVYPIVPLAWHGWTIGDYLRKLQAALAAVLAEFHARPAAVPGSFSLAGRAGILAAVGAAVRQGVTQFGAYVNVNPPLRDFGRVEVAGGQTMSSLLSQRALPTKMTRFRAALVTHLAEALELERYHLHTGHPLLAELPAGGDQRESAA
jgi:lipoyl(octanoyl) transferase